MDPIEDFLGVLTPHFGKPRTKNQLKYNMAATRKNKLYFQGLRDFAQEESE